MKESSAPYVHSENARFGESAYGRSCGLSLRSWCSEISKNSRLSPLKLMRARLSGNSGGTAESFALSCMLGAFFYVKELL